MQVGAARVSGGNRVQAQTRILLGVAGMGSGPGTFSVV